jgi:hypothetical protein
MTARSSAWALSLVFCAMGCSSSSSEGPSKPTGDDDTNNDSGNSEPSDAGTKGDSTVPGAEGGGDDTSSPHDGGSEAATTPSGAAAGDAGAAAFCAALCAGLAHCSPDAGGPCSCSPGDTAIRRADYASKLSTCVTPAIEAACGAAGDAVQNCQLQAAKATSATQVGSQFCQNLEFTFCSDQNCLVDFGSYSDKTISSFSSCSPDLPDASVDGGCNGFYTCIGTILSK